MTDQEGKNQRTGVLVSTATHVAVLVVFIFLAGWRAPDPPLPEYGVELNFGLDDQGSGENQPETPVGSEGTEAEDPAQTNPEKDAAAPTATAQKETAQKVNPTESPVTQEQAKENSPATKEVKAKEAETKPAVLAEFKKTSTATDGQPNATQPKKGEPGSQGDDTKKSGDQGSPEGKLDAKALYGTPGGGGGGTGMLNMDGWDWEVKPEIPALDDEQSGKIVFEIVCDEKGDIVGIKTIERKLSAKSEQLLRDALMKTSLKHTRGGIVPPRSTGLVTITLTLK